MVLIGLFALAFGLCWPTAASAEPISIALLTAIGGSALAGSAFAVAATTFLITTALSMALSFVAQALFRQPSRSGGASTPLQSQVTGQKFNVRVAAGPRVVIYGRTRVAGTYAFMHCTDDNTWLHLVIMFAGHEVDGFEQVTIGEETFNTSDLGDGGAYLDADGFTTSGKTYAGGYSFARFKFHTGTAGQAADQFLIDGVNDSTIWGPDHRLRGIAYAYVRLEFGPTGRQRPLFSDGLPNITAVIRGKKVYDPRSGTTVWRNNPALCLADYLCDTTYGVGMTYADAINETALIASANACDEDVTLAEGGTENRYEANGSFESSQQPQAVIGWLLGSMQGRAPYDGERWTILAGVYQSPTITLTEDDLRGGMTINTVTSRRDLVNAVKGTFTSPTNNWQEYDFPPVTSEAGATADGGVVWKDIALPFTTSASMSQRIAKIDLLKARKQITVAMPCKLTAWRVQAGDTVNVTYARWGWSAKPFEVRRARFVMEEGEGGPILGVDLDLAEISTDVYSWDTSEEKLTDSVPRTTLPNIADVVPPTNLTVTENLYSTLEGGGQKTSAELAWSASPDAFAVLYEPGYKLHADSDYIVLPRVSGTASTIFDLAPGLYDFRVAAVNHVGAVSDPVTTTVELTGIGAPPAGVGGLSVMAAGGLAIVRWNVPADVAIRVNGGIEFRHSPATSGATWATATPIGERVSGGNLAVLPLKAGTYLAKHYIRLANGVLQYSTVPATVYTAQVALTAFATLDTQTEDPTFGGAHTQTEVSSSKLRIVSGKNVGTYNWTTYLDNGSVKRCRITVGTLAAVTSRSDLVDSWEDVDSRPSWDTTPSGDEATALTYISTTNDDPAGSPSWSTYRLIDSAEFTCRAARFRTDLWSLDPTWNIEIEELSAVSEEIA